MMTNKIQRIDLRKNLGPNDSGNLIKENILSLHLRGHHAEFAFYIDEMLRSLQITRRTTLFLYLLEEATDLPYVKHHIRAWLIE